MKGIQFHNEELYFLYIYVSIIANSEKELERNLNKIEGILQSSGMMTRKANFREEQVYLSSLPLMNNNSVMD